MKNIDQEKILKEIAEAIKPLRKQAQNSCKRIGIFARNTHLGTNQYESPQKVERCLNKIEDILYRHGYLDKFEPMDNNRY